MRALLRIGVSLLFLGFFVYQTFFAYGREIDFGNDCSVYYKSGATKEEAQKLGDNLKELGYFGDGPAAVQVARDGDTYVFRFVTVDSAWNNTEHQKNFAVMSYGIAEEMFPGKEVRIELCDDEFKTKSSFAPEKPDAGFGETVAFGNNSVYYTEGVTKEQAEAVGKCLLELEYFGQGDADVQVVKDGEVFAVKFITIDSAWTDNDMKSGFAAVGHEVQQAAFPKQKVRVELTDVEFKTQASFEAQAAVEGAE